MIKKILTTVAIILSAIMGYFGADFAATYQDENNWDMCSTQIGELLGRPSSCEICVNNEEARLECTPLDILEESNHAYPSTRT